MPTTTIFESPRDIQNTRDKTWDIRKQSRKHIGTKSAVEVNAPPKSAVIKYIKVDQRLRNPLLTGDCYKNYNLRGDNIFNGGEGQPLLGGMTPD